MQPAAVLSLLIKADGVAQTSGALKQLDKAGAATGRTLDKTAGHAHATGAAFGALKKAAALAGPVLGAAGLAKGLSTAVSEFREAQKVGAQTASVLKSTGGAAKVTQKHIESLAGAISMKSGIDDEQIQSAENMLLTFTNVRNEVGKGNKIFDQATQVVTDMSVALGQSGKSSAIQLGKALNDPIKGVTALQRVGVTFNESQKKQIKTLVEHGHALDAQKLILKELNKEFGGSAAAQATAGDKLKVALGNLAEAAGGVLVPQLDKIARFMTNVINQFIAGEGIARVIIPVWKTLASTVSGVVTAIRDTVKAFQDGQVWAIALAGALAGLVAAYAAFKTVVAITKAWTAAQVALNVALSLNPIGLVVIAIAALAAGLAVAYAKSETFRKIVNGSFDAVKAAIAWVVPFFTKTLPGAFQSVIDWLRGHWQLILSIITGPFGAAAIQIVKHFDTIKDTAKALPGKVANAIKSAPGVLLDAGKWLLGQVVSGIESGLSLIGDAAKWLKDKIVGAIKSVFDMHSPSKVMEGLGLNMVKGLLNGFGGLDFVGWVRDKVKDLIDLPGKLLSNKTTEKALSGNPAKNAALGKAMMLKAGFDEGQWPALYALWMGESGWRADARNSSSGAFGIPQALPASKMGAKAVAGDAAAQIAWGLGYIRSVYGNPSNAYATWLKRSPHWYASGTSGAARGLAWVGEKGPELVNFKGGETVFNHGDSMRMAASFASMLGGYASGTGRRKNWPQGYSGFAQWGDRTHLSHQLGTGGWTLALKRYAAFLGVPSQPVLNAHGAAAADREHWKYRWTRQGGYAAGTPNASRLANLFHGYAKGAPKKGSGKKIGVSNKPLTLAQQQQAIALQNALDKMRHPAKGLPPAAAVASDGSASGSESDPNQPLIDAITANTEAVKQHDDDLKAVRDEMKRQTDFATSVANTSNYQLTKSLADILSGHIVGYGVAGRSFTPGSGKEFQY